MDRVSKLHLDHIHHCSPDKHLQQSMGEGGLITLMMALSWNHVPLQTTLVSEAMLV